MTDKISNAMLEQYRLAAGPVLTYITNNRSKRHQVKQPRHWSFDIQIDDTGTSVVLSLTDKEQSCTFRIEDGKGIRDDDVVTIDVQVQDGVPPKHIKHIGYWFGNLIWLSSRL